MQREELKKLLIEQIPENQLRSYIQAHDFPFSDGDLVKMAYSLAADCEMRTQLLNECASTLSDTAREFALNILNYLDEIKALFHENSACVYELKIKETPNSYEERYLCGSYQTAREMAEWFCKEYSVTLTERSDISICKRRIISEPQHYAEDYIAEVQLDERLKEIKYFSGLDSDALYPADCHNNCDECDMLCLCNDVRYPCILHDGDIVRFRNGFQDGFGVVMFCSTSDTADSHYIIKLSENLRLIHPDEIFNAHLHLEPYRVTKINADALPEGLQGICEELIAHLKATGRL